MSGGWGAIADSLSRALSRRVRIEHAATISGGSINRSARIDTDAGPFFVKRNAARYLAMFQAEAAGLDELAEADAVRVPRALACGADETQAWLVLEYLPLTEASDRAQRALGQRLAALHRHSASSFGWTRDNFIGSTPQINAHYNDWTQFWRERRLRPQLDLAATHGYDRVYQSGSRLLDRLDRLLAAHAPAPSLLHGDLWRGNAGATSDGEPVIFDPAVYYGDRETDLAMSELFGGFCAAFYAGYEEVWPLDAGYARRRDLYNLYHVLNHLNLFGGSYLAHAQRLLDRLLRGD